ncbi:nuclear transport factor 2 family protein [Zhongshania aquimaris]|uniref:Nuclear transport factor 2 family protein n=1 Tax=Zhongshania aquimaris TaxID=2857107 RepID=A0ABS6VVP9_9GAMM|nr:nuclear transport factor 2 family protein [Zhongshania aquimaris]MBW2942414.1 nuclear transport factor 2 family protein [Zhongshania aquimaris]
MIDTNQQIQIREIENIILEYATALDTKEYDLLDNIFSAEAKVEYVGIGECKGPKEVKELVCGVLEQCIETQHMLSNIRVKLNGSTAAATCYLQAIHLGKGDYEGQLLTIWGEYTDELALLDSGWRITKRTLRTIFSQGDIGLG